MTIKQLSESNRKSLGEAANRYRSSLQGSPGAAYLESRGLNTESIRNKFGLGYVDDPIPGNELYRGCLAIPYLRWSPRRGWSTVSIRFRRLDDNQPKYQTVAGDRPRLFNTPAMLKHSPVIAITEGELDAVAAQELCGIPAVGVAGSQTWKPHFEPLFAGYRDVYILADGDEPGIGFATTVAKKLPNSKIIPMPPGHDVNSLVLSQGKQALLERIYVK